jgi:uncharacterized phage protein (TIGR01671 family)
MREIKFRAWDTINKRMATTEDIVLDKNGLPYECGNTGELCACGCKAQYINPADEYEIMQYTGLKDKNGTPIFEDDIVRWEVGSTLVTLGDPDPLTRVIKWNEDKAMFDLYQIDGEQQKSGFALCERSLSRCEVIGNVHRNPELLLSKEAREQGEWEAQAEAQSHYEPEDIV